MPRTRSLAWAELKVGLVTIFSVIMTALLIFLLSGQGGFPWQQYGLKTVFDNIAGLKEGAPVRVAGLEVGSVKELNFIPNSDRVEVTMKLQKAMQSRVTTGSLASLGSVSLLGEAAVDITASSRGTPLSEWGYVRSGASASSLAHVATRASSGIEEITALVKDLRAGRGTVGKLFADDAIARDLDTLLRSLDDVARRVGSGNGTIGRLLNNPAAAESLEGSLRNLQDITGRIQRGEGSLGKLMADDEFARTLTGLTTNLNEFTGKLNRGDGTLGQLATNREPFDKFNSLLGRFDAVAAGLERGEGSAGMALKDKQLYENMNTTVVELRATLQDARTLIQAIKSDPKKYLNIKVSVFDFGK